MTANNRVKPEDIRNKLGAMHDEAQTQVEGARNQLVTAGVGVAIVLLVVAFALGRRGGKRSSAVIEVRRG